MNIRNYIMSQKSINLIMDDGTIRPIPVENPVFPKLKGFLDEHKYDKAGEIVDLASKIEKHSSGLFFVVDGIVWVQGETLPNGLSKRLVQFAENGLDVQPLMAFWTNLKMNPSPDSIIDLYAFLEHNDIPLTVDGCFIAYKRVKDNFFDCHSETFDNTPGKVVKMDREGVDPNRNVTCSSGLHVAAYNYAHTFYSNGKLLEVKVNPKDVVAVPTDYHNEKMRVCEYIVVRECEGPRVDEHLYTEDDSYSQDYYNDDSDWDDEDDLNVPLEEVEEVEEVEEGNIENMILNPDSRGRILIPSAIVRVAGFVAGQIVYVQIQIEQGRINVSNRKGINWKAYTVDKHNSLRVGRCLTNSYVPSVIEDGIIVLDA